MSPVNFGNPIEVQQSIVDRITEIENRVIALAASRNMWRTLCVGTWVGMAVAVVMQLMGRVSS